MKSLKYSYFAVFVLLSPSLVNAQQCGECSHMEAAGSRSCSSIQEADRYNYCIRQVTEAAARCWRVCTNYNGGGPAARGSTTR